LKSPKIDPALLKQIRLLSKTDRKRIGELIEQISRSFGTPHLHRGSGMRDLGKNVFECRLGLQSRLIFINHPEYLYFCLIGNHGEVKNFLKRL